MKSCDPAASAGRRSWDEHDLPEPAGCRLLVAGSVRDGARWLQGEVQRLARALRAFQKTHWLIVESDSDDATIARLRELEATMENFRFISLGRLRDKIHQRTERLAFCRNVYLDQIRNGSRYQSIELVMVADLDGTNSLISEDAILSCWRRDDWDVCTANQLAPCYDVWALRHPDWSPNDCWDQYRFLLRHNIGAEKARSVAVHSRMIRIDPGADWIEVDSAFGGLAIYRRRALDVGEYVGVDIDGRGICEHLSLHAALRARRRRIFINPKLINTSYTEHTAALYMRNRMMRVAKSALRRGLRGTRRRGAPE